MRWPWRSGSHRGKGKTAAERALAEAERKVEQAREMRIQAETQAASERSFLIPPLTDDDDVIVSRIEKSLRRWRQR